MSDLTKRLRDLTPFNAEDRETTDAAADRIEQLEAALRDAIPALGHDANFRLAKMSEASQKTFRLPSGAPLTASQFRQVVDAYETAKAILDNARALIGEAK